MRWVFLALCLLVLPSTAYATCAQIVGGDDAGGCVEIDSCSGDVCSVSDKGVYLDPIDVDNGNEQPILALGKLPTEQYTGATFHITQKYSGAASSIQLTTPATGHNAGDGTWIATDTDNGFSILNLEGGAVSGSVALSAVSNSAVTLSNSIGLVEVQPDGDTGVSADLELSENIDMMTDLRSIRDANGNEQLTFDSVPSAVNEITLRNAATGLAPNFGATGGDTNIGMKLRPKGTGGIELDNDVAPLLLRLGTGGTVRGTMRASVFAGTPLLDFISASTTGQVRVLNSAETILLMTCDDGLNDACSFQASRLVPQTTMPTCNSAFEGAMVYDGDGAVNGPCVCAELGAGLFTWQPLLPTAADCA